MIYLLDANVLITANHSYYPIDAVPEYWDWLRHHAAAGRIKLPIEIYEELKDGPDDLGTDPLFAWASDAAVKRAIVLDEDVDPALVQRVVEMGYAPDLTDDELERVGRDPFLVAHALRDPGDRCVVTSEVSSSKKKRANRKVPDVCDALGVRCLNPFQLNKALDFRTNWRSRA